MKNWEYDEDSEELFQYFRISANAIYPMKIHGNICYLRFSPVSEKSEENVLAELAFIEYLRNQRYPAIEAVISKSGDQLVRTETSLGAYYASVFKKVAGKQISQTDFNDEIMYAYGAALGELHALSRKYENPNLKRWSHVDVFDWIEKTLTELGLDQKAMRELTLLRSEFGQLTINQENYGLIHFDFEPDNVFYDETSHHCSVIDFDDAMYHWYVMDIVQALNAIQDEMELDDCSHQQALFLQGYLGVCKIDENLFKLKPLFKRFAKLFQYTRVARAIEERFEGEPDWMVSLREKLEGLLMETRLNFGE
jgi:Ser/Thr protein kinase RdoA (MazF antagonist)